MCTLNQIRDVFLLFFVLFGARSFFHLSHFKGIGKQFRFISEIFCRYLSRSLQKTGSF